MDIFIIFLSVCVFFKILDWRWKNNKYINGSLNFNQTELEEASREINWKLGAGK